MKPEVLLLETVSGEADGRLQAHCGVLTPGDRNRTGSYENVKAIITRGKGVVDASILSQCPALRVIARCGVGLDNIDVELATRRNIPVLNTPGMNADTVAEHTIALILMLVRKMSQSIEEVQEGNWEFRKSYHGDEVRGKKLGILGLGSIGRRVAKIAQVLGMEVLVLNRHDITEDYQPCTFRELLENADIISLHLPLTEKTRHLMGEQELAMMKPGAILINTARGSIIDQYALKRSLLSGNIGGFGADVLDEEPPVDLDFLQLPNVHVTPHSASLTRTTYNQICLMAVENVLKVLKDEPVERRFVYNADGLHPPLDIQIV